MAKKPFYSLIDRYVEGEYIRGSPEAPGRCLIDVDKFPGYKNDKNLIPVDAEAPPKPVELKPAFSKVKPRRPGVEQRRGEKAGVGKQPGDETPRASDTDPATEGTPED